MMLRLFAGATLFLCALHPAFANDVTVPVHRALGATQLYDETTNPPQPTGVAGHPLYVNPDGVGNGIDKSFNAPSVGTLGTLIGTIAANANRRKLEVMIACAAGGNLVLDDQAGAITATVIPLDGGSANGKQGGGWSSALHSGRVRVYSSNASCQVSAREY